MLQRQLFLLTTGNGYNEVLSNLLTVESECKKLSMAPKSPHSHMEARHLKTLKTNIDSTTAAVFEDLERRVDKFPKYRITRPNAKETIMKLLKQINLRKTNLFHNPQEVCQNRSINLWFTCELIEITECITRNQVILFWSRLFIILLMSIFQIIQSLHSMHSRTNT